MQLPVSWTPTAENGMLASRIEILARYQGDTIKKFGELRGVSYRAVPCHAFLTIFSLPFCWLAWLAVAEKKQAAVELEHKITRRYLKQLRKRQSGEWLAGCDSVSLLLCKDHSFERVEGRVLLSSLPWSEPCLFEASVLLFGM